jgi:L-fuconolactonase
MSKQIIDSHQHFWQIEKFNYEWMSPTDKILYRDFLPDNFEQVLQQNGVAKSVAVQAHQSIEEARWLLELSDQFDFIAGVVGWVDLQSENLSQQLDELTKHPKFKGVRHVVQDEPDDDWIIRPKVIEGIKTLVKYDLTYDILVFPRHLKYVKILLENCPEIKFVIDHFAKPPIASGEIAEWSNDIIEVAKFPNVYCKLSGLVTEANHQNWTKEDLQPYINVAMEAFGANRLMYGSDYPVCLLAASYQKVLETYQSFLADLTEDEQNQILFQNATEFYKL